MIAFVALSCLSQVHPLSPGNAPVQLAIAARVYHAPADHRVSTPVIYLCDLHGGHLHKIKGFPSRYREFLHVRWVDSNRLQWQGVTKNSTYESGEYDLRTGKLQSKTIKDLDWEFSKRGSEFRDTGVITSTDPANPGRLALTEETGTGWTYTNPQGTKLIDPISGSPRGMHFEPKTNRLWLLDWDHNSTTGTRYDLCTFNWHTHKVVPVIEDANVVDFRFDRDFFAATKTRDLADYGKKRSVWVAAPFVGNWKTGKTWFPMKGLVYATGIAIRP